MTITLRLPKPHSQQFRIKREAARFNVTSCGRRFGKTTLGIDLSTPALHGYPVGWFAPSYKMLIEVWRDLVRIFKPVSKRVSVQEHRIELLTDGIIEAWSLDNPDAGRGRKYKRVIIDEAAIVARLQEAWQASIRPTLTDLEGDAFFLSTPKGHNFFKVLFDLGIDPLKPDWKSWHFPTSDNPHIKASEIEAARLELPERIFQQEYLANFIDDSGSVFRRIIEASNAKEQQQAEPGHSYVFGVDWGKHNDFTVISVIDSTSKEQVHIDRFNQIDYVLQVERLKSLYEKFIPQVIVAESNAMGEPIIERLLRDGLPVVPFQTTNASKGQAIEALSLAFERGELSILNDPVQIAELQAYEMERLPSGLMRYNAPAGLHDDTVIALALAWQEASLGGFEIVNMGQAMAEMMR